MAEFIYFKHQNPAVYAQQTAEQAQVYQWINDLSNPEKCENALHELSKKKEVIPNLGPMLWHSFGTISTLLLEIMNVYPFINPPTLTGPQANRVCNALALLQPVATHPETRPALMKANLPQYLYPFLYSECNTKAFEYLRITSLSVIGAMVLANDKEVVAYLLNTELIPICLKIMSSGSDLNKMVATFIMQKILEDASGLAHICETYHRFAQVVMTLGKMVIALGDNPSARLLKHVVLCYLHLTYEPRARESLKECLPNPLRNMESFASCIAEDYSILSAMIELLGNIGFAPLH